MCVIRWLTLCCGVRQVKCAWRLCNSRDMLWPLHINSICAVVSECQLLILKPVLGGKHCKGCIGGHSVGMTHVGVLQHL